MGGIQAALLFVTGHIVGLVWQIEAVLMVRYDVYESVAKFRLLQSEHALIDLLLQYLAGVLIVHKLAHSGSEQPLIIELLVLTLARALSAIFLYSLLFDLNNGLNEASLDSLGATWIHEWR